VENCAELAPEARIQCERLERNGSGDKTSVLIERVLSKNRFAIFEIRL